MEREGGILFLLGAGASVDSGLPVYRGPSGIYKEGVEKILHPNNNLGEIWDFLRPLYRMIEGNCPGSTYQSIKILGDRYPGSLVVTQNIDGYAKWTGLDTIELHGTTESMTCLTCKKRQKSDPDQIQCSDCEGYCRPDITLFGEKINEKHLHRIYKYIKDSPAMMMIIGTSLQFPYLKDFILKAKAKGVRIFHINPDEEYGENVAGKDIWYQVSASEGLQLFIGKS